VCRRHGVYALYKKDKLYYVGLASNLQSRLNRQAGKFNKSENLKRRFKRDINNYHKRITDGIFGKPTRNNLDRSITVQRSHRSSKESLVDYIKSRIHIRFEYKGHLYIAHVRKDGAIKFASESYRARELQGKIYNSPSLASVAVKKRRSNGWKLWKYERSPGEWVLLDELRKKIRKGKEYGNNKFY